MLEFDTFIKRIVSDLKNDFEQTDIDNDMIVIGTYPTNVTIPANSIYREYKLVNNYKETLVSYIKIINDILSQYKFTIDYNNIYPIIKANTFGTKEKIRFYRKDLFLNLQVLYVTDMGETFRFITYDDEGVDFIKMEVEALKNLNKMTNILSKLDDSMEIYALRFTSDYGATMILNQQIIVQIDNKVGSDYLFALPSASTLLIAKYSPANAIFYAETMQRLMVADDDPNIIDKHNVYRRDRFGNYSIFHTSKIKEIIIR